MQHERSFRRFALIVVTAFVAVVTGPSANATGDVDLWLTILHNNDGESQLIDAGGGLEDFGGAARFKTLVDKLKGQVQKGPGRRAGIFVSSGDNFLAGPEFNASLDAGVFFDAIALDRFRYDAIVLGNHDFDFGPDILVDFINQFLRKVPYISANLDFSEEPGLQVLANRKRIVGSIVVNRRGKRIGVVGATTEQLPFISSPRNTIVNEVAGAIQGEIDALTAGGVNIIVVVSHLQSINEDIALALELTGVDVMIAGGGDELLANADDVLLPGDEADPNLPYPMLAIGADGANIPVVTTSGSYRYLGRLVVGLNAAGEVVALDDPLSGPVRVAGGTEPDAVPPDPIVQALVVDPVVDFVESLAANVIGTSEVDLDGVRGNVRTMETNEGNLIADSLFWQATQLAGSFGTPVPDVALQNGGGIRNDAVIPAGDITELDTFDMVPFGNFVTLVAGIPRDQFKEIMENAVSQVENVGGRFAQISGFSMTYDAAGTAQELDADGNVTTAGTRVLDITLDDGTQIVSGGTVVAGDALNIATIDFLARGGDQYPYRGAPFTPMGVSYQQALSAYIEDALAGSITAAQYPEGGEGRITRIN